MEFKTALSGKQCMVQMAAFRRHSLMRVQSHNYTPRISLVIPSLHPIPNQDSQGANKVRGGRRRRREPPPLSTQGYSPAELGGGGHSTSPTLGPQARAMDVGLLQKRHILAGHSDLWSVSRWTGDRVDGAGQGLGDRCLRKARAGSAPEKTHLETSQCPDVQMFK